MSDFLKWDELDDTPVTEEQQRRYDEEQDRLLAEEKAAHAEA